MQALQKTPSPHDFTIDQIKAWLEALKAAADDKAIHLLIVRTDIENKTTINVTSTLTAILGEDGCGGGI